MAGYTPARVAVLGQGLPFAGARRVRADQVSAGDVYVDGLVGHRSDKVPWAPGTPESVRVNVWPGRTALTVHWFTVAVSTRLTMTWKPCACSWVTVALTGDGPDFFVKMQFAMYFGCRWFKRPSRSLHRSAFPVHSLLFLRILLSSKAQHSSRRTRRLRIGDYVVDRATSRACASGFAAELSCCVSVGRFSYAASLVPRSGRRSGSPFLAPPRFFLIRQSDAVPSCRS
jgi:hypothetical protein